MMGSSVIAVALLASFATPLVSAHESMGRLLNRAEIYELAVHVRQLPPYRSDVTVLVEYTLPKLSDGELRQSVENLYRGMDREEGRVKDDRTFASEVDTEVKRLQQEQQLPRRIKERWRRDGARYRVDEVRTRTGLEPIDATTEWQSSFISLSTGPGSPQDTARLDWTQKIKSVFGRRHGNVQAPREVWAGGTVGLSVALIIKQALGMDVVAREGGSDPVEERVAEIQNGTHSEIDIRIVEEATTPDIREFRIGFKRSEVKISVVAPSGSLSPIRRVEVRDANDKVTYRMVVQAEDTMGIATRWTEELIRIPERGTEKCQFELIERHLHQPLDDTTFTISRPEGWILADHRPEKIVVTGRDGLEMPVENERDNQPLPPQSRVNRLWWFFLANLISVIAIGYAIWIRRSRAT